MSCKDYIGIIFPHSILTMSFFFFLFGGGGLQLAAPWLIPSIAGGARFHSSTVYESLVSNPQEDDYWDSWFLLTRRTGNTWSIRDRLWMCFVCLGQVAVASRKH